MFLLAAACQQGPEGVDRYWDIPTRQETSTFTVKVWTPVASIEGTRTSENIGAATIGEFEYEVELHTYQDLPGFEPMRTYSRLGEDGIYERDSLDASEPEYLALPLPPTVGRKWAAVKEGVLFNMEIVAIADVDTIERTYKDCVKVEGTTEDSELEIDVVTYVAPDIGVVRTSAESKVFVIEEIRRAK